LRNVVFALVVGLVATACGGGDSGSIEVQEARFRLAREDLGAGYMTISNTTGDDVTLEAVSADGVGRIELHESVAADDGTMAMESRPDGFLIEAGQTVSLQPGGKHLMLFDPENTDDLTLDLDFGDQTVSVVASFDEEASAMSDMDDMDHSEHGGSEHGGDHKDDDAMDDMDHSEHDDAMDDDAMDDDASR